MTVIDLKAMAYDVLVQIEQLQIKLRQINQQIEEELAKPKEKPPKE